MMTPRRMLGLAVMEGSIAAVEVGVVHGARRVLRAAEFPLPEGDAAGRPPEGAGPAVALGKALRQFLRQHHFSASRCVIGLGTRWLIARERPLPPTAPDLLAGVLAIATEREFASDAKDLAFDYSGPVDSPQGQSVLLVAAPRQTVDDLLATARAAGLTVRAVTSSMMALASATGGEPGARRLVLRLAPNEAELGVQSGGSVRLLRRLPSRPPVAGSPAADGWLEGLAGELRRVVALLPGAQTPQPAPELVIWNESGLPAGALGTLGPRLALEMRLCGYPADLGIADAPAPSGRGPSTAAGRAGCPPPAGGEYAAAAALALAGLGPAALAVDFAHSRLSPRKKLALRKKVVWGGGLAALLLLAGLALLLDVRGEEQAVQDLRDQLGGMKESLAVAKEIVDKATFARGWYDRRSRHLDCLRELTLAFPLEGRIWTTSLAISEDMRVLLSGKASDERAVLEVLDHLKASPRFSDVKPLYIREVGGGARDVSFAISLNFVKADRS